MLKGMNQLWRRNIKKAAKEGVEVTAGDPAHAERDLKLFHDLYVHTAERDHFTPRGAAYFRTMLDALAGEDPDRIRFWFARHDGDLVAATIAIRVGTHAWYSYGASSTEKREVRGSNAVQWAMIRDALAAGAEVYDLRGITDTLDADDPHVGLVQFKVGTGGEAVEYAGEWDLPLNRLLYRAFDEYLKRRMSLTLTVDGDRWRTHLRAVARRPPRPGAGHQGQRLRLRQPPARAPRGLARRRHGRRRHLRGAARGRLPLRRRPAGAHAVATVRHRPRARAGAGPPGRAHRGSHRGPRRPPRPRPRRPLRRSSG